MAQRRPHAGGWRAGLLAAEGPQRGGAGAGVNERRLLDAARVGDEDAFARLTEPHRRALHAHCYRMLGSVTDAEDALQEALLNAWRGLPRFEGRSSLRSWLYTIATNACLRAIERRPKRVLPIDYAPAGDPHDGLAEPLVESVWVEPYPDERHGLEDGLAGPEARYEQRESVDRYVDAFERADVDALVEMLAADGAFSMPPLPTWYRGREAVAAFLKD